MIYTCYEMIRDCRAGRAEGWSYLIANYVTVMRQLLAHYGADDPARLDRLLVSLHDPASSLFQSLDPAPERPFLAALRQHALAQIDIPPPGIEIDLPALAAALEPLTLVEKQAVWLETMDYDAGRAGAMLRMSPATIQTVRARAGDLVRARVDAWRSTLLAENGLALGRAAAASRTAECLPSHAFLDVLDGRATWRGRQELERHVTACWHCIDHFCRLIEVAGLVRDNRPLSEADAAPYRALLGIPAPKTGFWKRLTRAGTEPASPAYFHVTSNCASA